MIIIILLIGVILIIAAIRNSQNDLFAALAQDVPAYIIWGAALFAVGAIGFIPGLKPVSRALLALIIVVLVLRNYKAILAGFQNFWTNPPTVGGGASTSTASAPSVTGGGGSFGGGGASASWANSLAPSSSTTNSQAGITDEPSAEFNI